MTRVCGSIRRFACARLATPLLAAATLGLIVSGASAQAPVDVHLVSVRLVKQSVMLPDGTFRDRPRFEVEAVVRDGSDAEVVRVCERHTCLYLLDPSSQSQEPPARLLNLEYADGSEPRDPREFTVRLLFDTAQRTEIRPVHLVVAVDRYRQTEASFEWGPGGAPLEFPLLVIAGPVFSAVGSMTLSTERDPDGNLHATLPLKGVETAHAMNSPMPSFGNLSLVTADGATLSPDMVYSEFSRTPFSPAPPDVSSHDACHDDIRVTYHFFGTSELPTISKMTLRLVVFTPFEEVSGADTIP